MGRLPRERESSALPGVRAVCSDHMALPGVGGSSGLPPGRPGWRGSGGLPRPRATAELLFPCSRAEAAGVRAAVRVRHQPAQLRVQDHPAQEVSGRDGGAATAGAVGWCPGLPALQGDPSPPAMGCFGPQEPLGVPCHDARGRAALLDLAPISALPDTALPASGSCLSGERGMATDGYRGSWPESHPSTLSSAGGCFSAHRC